MKRYLIFYLAVIVIFMQGCGFNSINGKGAVTKQDRNVNDFQEIELECSADIFVSQGPSYSCTVETNENLHGYLLIDKDGKNLRIHSDKNLRADKMNIYITMPIVEKLVISGSGSINGKNSFLSDKLNLNISGSGNINMDKIKVEKLMAEIEGSGNIKLLTGEVQHAKYIISGSGKIEADKISAKEVEAEIEGSGNIYCYAGDELRAKISGSGSVKYKGAPKTKFTVEGSGNVSSY
ncbi:MAG TPA: head GIN domain-containing protein [Saprospiraceae bacterium]|nr:head GIN domain-containing protein [Saprospiraceae bacterium]